MTRLLFSRWTVLSWVVICAGYATTNGIVHTVLGFPVILYAALLLLFKGPS